MIFLISLTFVLVFACIASYIYFSHEPQPETEYYDDDYVFVSGSRIQRPYTPINYIRHEEEYKPTEMQLIRQLMGAEDNAKAYEQRAKEHKQKLIEQFEAARKIYPSISWSRINKLRSLR